MQNPLIAKLSRGCDLSRADHAVILDGLGPVKRLAAGQDIISEGDRPERVNLVLSGLACRYKILPDGARHIMAYLVPGDFCDLHITVLGKMDHAIGTLAPCEMSTISTETVAEWTCNQRINHTLWWATLVDEAILREWLINMGARRAPERVGHLFCELLVRLQAVGLGDEDGYRLPLTQAELGATLGLSLVHMNRVLRHLREQDLAVFSYGRVAIPDVKRLQRFSAFSPDYLHLEGSPARVIAAGDVVA